MSRYRSVFECIDPSDIIKPSTLINGVKTSDNPSMDTIGNPPWFNSSLRKYRSYDARL